MSAEFSTKPEEVLGRAICVDQKKRNVDLKTYYEIDRCEKFLEPYSKVALQFPDHLLVDSITVAAMLEKNEDDDRKIVYILGDTSYGSCCVDEVAAEHMAAECIIHFGPSCLTQTKRLPVLHIFGQEQVDVADCCEKFSNLFSDHSQPVLILYDTIYSHCIETFLNLVLSHGYMNTISSELSLPHPVSQASHGNRVKRECCQAGACCNGTEIITEKMSSMTTNVEEITPVDCSDRDNTFVVRCGRKFSLSRPIADYKVFYIGEEGACLVNLLLNITECEFFSYSPVTRVSRPESAATNKMLGKRYYLVQKAKEAKAVGILVGTLGAANYLPMIKRLKYVLQRVGKKYYTIAVGKLNPAKLANFMEVDVYVLVACPECSLHDFKVFYQPVVTPYEMEVACLSCREWNGRPITDYQQLLPGGDHHVCIDSNTHEEEVQFSFITGGLIQAQYLDHEPIHEEQGAIVPRQDMSVALPHSASYLHSRSWSGLEQKLGETPVSSVVEGRRGVPVSYSHETDSMSNL